jgi:hypothetical protein
VGYHKLKVGEQTVEVTTRRMTVDEGNDLLFLFGNYQGDPNTGRLASDFNLTRIRNTVYGMCLKSLAVNGKECEVPAAKPLGGLPDIEDDEYEDNVADEVLRVCVKDNGRLHRKMPFAEIFGRFAPSEARKDERDPTKSAGQEGADTATSTPGPSSTTP